MLLLRKAAAKNAAMSASPKADSSRGGASSHGNQTLAQRLLLGLLRSGNMGPRALLSVVIFSFMLSVVIVATSSDGENSNNGGNRNGPQHMMMAEGFNGAGAVASDSSMMMGGGGAPEAMAAPAMAPMPAVAHGKRMANRAGAVRPKMAAAAGMADAAPHSFMAGGPTGNGMTSADFDGARMDAVRQSVHDMQSVKHDLGGGEEDPTVLKGLILLKEASLSGEVPDILTAMARIETDVSAKYGGHAESSNSWTDQWLAQRLAEAAAREESRRNGGRHVNMKDWQGPTGASMHLRVPVDKFESALTALKKLVDELGGKVTTSSTSARDVTAEYVDVVARQKADELAAAQLEKLMTAATTVHEVLSVKRELDGINQRIESAKSQRKSLESRATFSSLHVSLALPQPPQEPSPTPSPRPGWSPLRTAGSAFGTLAKAGMAIVDVVVYTLVLVVPVGAAVALLLAVGRKAGRPLVARVAAAFSGAVSGSSHRSSSAVAGGGGGSSGAAESAGAYHALQTTAVD